MDFSWLIGGPQGSGVETASNIFTQIFARMGYEIFGEREFYSNIKGEHSYFVVRVSDEKIHSNVNDLDMIVSYDADTIFRHFQDLSDTGTIIYDSDLDDVSTTNVNTLEPIYLPRPHGFLESKEKPFTIKGVIEYLQENGVLICPISFRTILSDLAKKAGNENIKKLNRMYNVIGVSLSMGFLNVSRDYLVDSVLQIFSKKPEVAELNKTAAGYAYRLLENKSSQNNFPTKDNQTILLQGFHGTALGKIQAGCRFQSYYPITPASDESFFLESNNTIKLQNNEKGGLLVVQVEDEISAIGMAIGSSLTGTRASTSTSGPGFSLMAEALGWSGINEIPLVITLYQRSGPSTGLPTRHGQDDLMFAIYGGHGEFPRIVYASGTVEESFYDTMRCFNYSDIFQVPVIHMMDKALASSTVTCAKFDPYLIPINRGKFLPENNGKECKRFEIIEGSISPRPRLGMDGNIFWNTGDERDPEGHICEDPVNRIKMMKKRLSRLEKISNELPDQEQLASYGIYENTILSWGSPTGPILDAIEILKNEEKKIGFIQIKLLHPFPSKLVKKLIENVEKIIIIESNYLSSLSMLFEQNTKRDVDYKILKFTGRPMTSSEIYKSLNDIIDNKAEKVTVLSHGA